MPELLPLRLARRRPGLIRPTLDQVTRAAAALGNPERRFPCIRIAGTNGKGSTAAMLAAILHAHGLATGLYTSPHLVRVEERLEIDGRRIARDELEAVLARLDPFPDLSFFEALTLAALLWFARRRVDAAVLETGLGGRWDATRIAPAAAAGITNIGTDHRQWLGPSREAIAAEKGPALAGAAVAVLGPQVEPAVVPHLGAPRAVPAAELVHLEILNDATVSADWGEGPVTLPLPLPGRHQAANLHLALALAKAAAVRGLFAGLRPDAVREGLARVRWPGRLSAHTIAGRRVLLDGAHNVEAAAALAAYLERSGRRYNLLFSCLADKPVRAMAGLLRPLVGRVAVFPLPGDRAMPVEELAAAFPDALRAPEARAGLDRLPDPVLAAGSLRVVGELLAHLDPDGDGSGPPRAGSATAG